MNYKLTTGAGNSFDTVSVTAKRIAKEKKQTVEFEFNGVICLVDKETNLDWLYRDYSNSWTMDWKTVGPHCVPAYAHEVQSEFDKKTKEREEKQAAIQAEYEAKNKLQRMLFEEKTKGVAIELNNAKGWKQSLEANTDSYGKCAMDYAEGWAKLMQLEFSNGKTLQQCAEETSHELGFYGITGFMYGCAVSILSKCWIHGEELRRWHNKEYNHEGEGVVNPAILSFSA